ncbi:MAG: Gldg family protein [Planctomycetota bacterium]
MTRNRSSFYSGWLVSLGVLVVLLVLANLLARRFDWRADLTRDGLHTVSEETEKILAKLTDQVLIKYHVSEKLPPGYQNLRRDTIDFLKEYQRLAGGKLRFEVIDPYRVIDDYVREKEAAKGEGEDDDKITSFNPFAPQASTPAEEKKQELARMGIPELQGRSIEDDRFEIFRFYSSIEIRYLDNPPEVISVHSGLDGLEYELANRVVKLAIEEKPKVAFFLGRPEELEDEPPNPQAPYAPAGKTHPYRPFLRQVLGEHFDVTEIELTEASSIPEDAKLLIVAEPDGLDDRQIYEIDRSIASGRPAVILASHTTGELGGQFSLTPIRPGLDTPFKKWGISLGSELVSSRLCGSVEVVRRERNFGLTMRMPTEYALCPMARGRGINQESPITQGLGAIVFPYAAPLGHDREKLDEAGLKLTVLGSTADDAWLSPWRPQPDESMLRGPEDGGGGGPGAGGRRSRHLAYLLEGTCPSAFNEGDPVPPWPEGTDGEESGEESQGSTEDESGEKAADTEAEELIPALEPRSTQVVVIASADLAKVESLQRYRGNVAFLLNAVESLALGEDLVRIRAKTQVARPLRESEAWERNLVTYGNMIGVPLLIMIAGLARFGVRRGRSRGYEAEYLRKTGGQGAG